MRLKISSWIVITILIITGGYLLIDNTLMQNSAINSPDRSGYHPLSDTNLFPEGQHREAIQAIIVELQNQGENPQEFYAQFKPDQTASKLTFNLIKEGNPSDKDRQAIYDLISKRVNFLFFQ